MEDCEERERTHARVASVFTVIALIFILVGLLFIVGDLWSVVVKMVEGRRRALCSIGMNLPVSAGSAYCLPPGTVATALPAAQAAGEKPQPPVTHDNGM